MKGLDPGEWKLQCELLSVQTDVSLAEIISQDLGLQIQRLFGPSFGRTDSFSQLSNLLGAGFFFVDFVAEFSLMSVRTNLSGNSSRKHPGKFLQVSFLRVLSATLILSKTSRVLDAKSRQISANLS